jgi:NAD(P)-dependent dehydrogenase (short-subunit alcohol dehydrogenase family)
MKGNWTTAHIQDLTGKTMLVTEGDSCIGYESVKAFALNGAETILTYRDVAVGERIKAEILKLKEKSSIEVMPLDLTDAVSIRQFADAFNAKYKRLDVLMNIGDSHTIPVAQAKASIGKHIASDHAGHSILTGLLLPALGAANGSRVVNISVGEHKLRDKDFHMIASHKGHGNANKHKIGAHKWAIMLFTYQLQKHFETAGINSISVAAYHGPNNRNLQRRLANKWNWKMFKPVYSMFTGPDSLQSATPAIRAALAKDVKGGEYYGPNGFVEVMGYPSFAALGQFGM